MTFEELMDKACSLTDFPEMEGILLPSTLSEETKEKVLKLSLGRMGSILKNTIDQINHGSIESVGAMMRRTLLW